VNAAEEAVAQELLPSEELFTSIVMTQLLHLVFVFTPAANLVMDEFFFEPKRRIQ